jgi:hypothetical protein
MSVDAYGVGDVVETKSGGVEGSGGLGIANPETNVIKTVENADGGLIRR